MKKAAKKVSKSSKKSSSYSTIVIALIATVAVVGGYYTFKSLMPSAQPLSINETVTATIAEQTLLTWNFDNANELGSQGWILGNYKSTPSAKVESGFLTLPGTLAQNTNLWTNKLESPILKNTIAGDLIVEVKVKSLTPQGKLSAPANPKDGKRYIQAPLPTTTTSPNPFDHIMMLGVSDQTSTTVSNKDGDTVTRWTADKSKEITASVGVTQSATFRFVFTKSDLAKMKRIGSMRLDLSPKNGQGLSNLTIDSITIKYLPAPVEPSTAPVVSAKATGIIAKSSLTGREGYIINMDADGYFWLEFDPNKIKINDFVGKHVEITGTLSYPELNATIPDSQVPIFNIQKVIKK